MNDRSTESSRALKEIDQRVEAAHKAAGVEQTVFYSAYGYSTDDVPIDNLDETPVVGKMTVIVPPEILPISALKGFDVTMTMESPTWLNLCVVASRIAAFTGCGLFFEGIVPQGLSRYTLKIVNF